MSSIIPTPTNGNSALAEFGARDEIREIADRLCKMMPGTQTLTTAEALTVAQIAVAHRLDPFNGEVWGIKGENGKWYGVMVGIKGLRRAARRQAEREGCTYWPEFVQVEPEQAGERNAGAIVYRCILRDTATMQAWGKSVNILTSAGVPYKDAIAMLGAAPQVVGIGIATPDERSKMGIHQRARKRAEADALKQRFDISFGGAEIALDDEPETVAVDFVDAQPEPAKVEQPAALPQKSPVSQADLLAELGYS